MLALVAVKRALDDLAVPAPIGAQEDETGPAVLAMAAAALEETEATRVLERLQPTRQSIELAAWALRFGYHVHFYTPEADDVDEQHHHAGLVVHGPATRADVQTALDSRHAIIVSSLGDGPPFLLVPRSEEDGLVVYDPSVDEHPLTWSWQRLDELLEAQPGPRVLELAPRTRVDR